MTKSDLKRRVDSQVCLPALPGVLTHVLDACHASAPEIRTVARLVACDPSMTAQMLRLVSSPVTRRRPMPELPHLTENAGINALRDVALSTAVSSQLPPDTVFAAHEGHFWRHALATAQCAQSLSALVQDVTGQEAYAAGLLHDIGKLVLQAVIPDEYGALMERVRSEHIPLASTEQEEFGVTHAQVGKWLAESWNFPERITQVIWLHHHPTGSLDDTRFPSTLLDLLSLAQVLAHTQRSSEEGDAAKKAFTQQLLKRLSLKESDVADAHSAAEAAFDQKKHVLHFDQDGQRRYQEVLRDSVREALHQRATLATEERQLHAKANRLRVLQDATGTLDERSSFVDVVSSFVGAIRQGLELETGLCLVADADEEYLYGQSWSGLADRPEDLYVHLATGEATGFDKQPESQRLTVERHVLSRDESGWIGGRIRALSLRDGFAFAPMRIEGFTVGLVLFEEEALGAGTVHDLSHDVALYTSAFAHAFVQCRATEDRSDESEELATALGRRVPEAPAAAPLAAPAGSTFLAQMAKGAAHSINNPLMVISGEAQVTMTKSDDLEVKRSMQTVVDSCRRAGLVLSDMLAFGQPPEPHLEPVMINYVLHRVVDKIRERLEGIGIQVNELLGEGLPRVSVDPKLMELVFQKILQNAIDAMRQSGGLLTIETVEAPDRSAVKVRIGDTGIGIAEEHQSRIFEPFFTTKERADRPGLGLAVAYGLVRKHDGAIKVDSTPGGGTIFEVALPCTVETAPEKPAREAPASDLQGAKWGRILVVDDEADLRRIIEESLERHGYFVRTAGDGKEALGILATTKIDAVVLDLQMPRKSGLEVLSEIHQKFRALPVIIMTGYGTQDEIDEAMRLGAQACLTKPFEMKRLIGEIAEATSQQTYPI